MRIFARFRPSCAYANEGAKKGPEGELTNVKKLKVKILI